MIRIGPYKLERISYDQFDPEQMKMVRVKRQLFITHDEGESMGCSKETEAKLIAMLDEFWRKEF